MNITVTGNPSPLSIQALELLKAKHPLPPDVQLEIVFNTPALNLGGLNANGLVSYSPKKRHALIEIKHQESNFRQELNSLAHEWRHVIQFAAEGRDIDKDWFELELDAATFANKACRYLFRSILKQAA